ncbi:hypothetical protein BJX65DRAFT_142698 [Aspergillus insuetus]
MSATTENTFDKDEFSDSMRSNSASCSSGRVVSTLCLIQKRAVDCVTSSHWLHIPTDWKGSRCSSQRGTKDGPQKSSDQIPVYMIDRGSAVRCSGRRTTVCGAAALLEFTNSISRTGYLSSCCMKGSKISASTITSAPRDTRDWPLCSSRMNKEPSGPRLAVSNNCMPSRCCFLFFFRVLLLPL